MPSANGESFSPGWKRVHIAGAQAAANFTSIQNVITHPANIWHRASLNFLFKRLRSASGTDKQQQHDSRKHWRRVDDQQKRIERRQQRAWTQ